MPRPGTAVCHDAILESFSTASLDGCRLVWILISRLCADVMPSGLWGVSEKEPPRREATRRRSGTGAQLSLRFGPLHTSRWLSGSSAGIRAA
jgi:hypothetical protein